MGVGKLPCPEKDFGKRRDEDRTLGGNLWTLAHAGVGGQPATAGGRGGLFPHFLKTPPARLEVSMYVDLIKALSAAAALLLFGKPEHVYHDFSIRLVLDSRGSAALELAYDPVLQYTR